MAESKIRASDQVMSESITNELIPNTEIELVKLAEVVLQADGGQALTGDWNVGMAFGITGIKTPVNSSDVVNKQYVDQAIEGHSWKDPVIKMIHYVKATAGAPTGTPTADECCLNTNEEKIYTATFSEGWSWDAGASLSTGDRYLFGLDGYDESGGSGTYVADNKIYQKYTSATTGTTPSANWTLFVEHASHDCDADTQWTFNDDDSAWVQSAPAPTTLYKSKVSAGDSTPGYLGSKIGAGSGLNGMTVNPGGDEVWRLYIGAGDGIQVDTTTVTVKLNGSTLAKDGSGLKVSSGGISSVELATDSVTPFKLNGYDEPADGEIPTYRNASQNFEWKNITALDTYKVKADTGDASPDYLDGKVDASTIIVNGSDKVEVDVTNIIDTAYALTENTNKIRINLASDAGLEFDTNQLRVKLDGSTLGRSASGMKVSSGGISSVELATDSVTPFKLKGYNEPSDGYVPTYRNATQNFEWKTQGAILTASAVWEDESSNCNGANTSFTLDYSPVLCADSTHHIIWCLHNTTVRTEGASADFSISGTTVTTYFTPKTGDTLVFLYFK